MSTKRLESWAWILIFGGLGLVGLGMAVRPADGVLGLVIWLLGAALAIAGVVLVVVRSRRPDEDRP